MLAVEDVQPEIMSADNKNLEEILFDLALQKPTAEERFAFLDHACRDNPALRSQVEELLDIHFGAAGFLLKTTPNRPNPLISYQTEGPRQTIGRYKLLENIGEGGFGEVWMAEQREPVKRRVALKIIKLGMDTRQVVARFEAERQALALMDHPNIAKVFDAGATDMGRPYFVMELVRGAKITEYCDKNALPAVERLKLFIQVCQAIQHAHQKGIIHRDIKPSNILVTLHDGIAVPKVIDFGIAKATQFELTDKTLFTQFQQFIGTPAYISPEQAETSGLDIDTRSDIYSLGVLLYELLVGQTPFDAKEMTKGGIDALRQIIREKEPPKPSTKLKTLPVAELTTTAHRRHTDPVRLGHLLRGDLDWIVMKCLEKDRARRYETANGLAMDIQRYLANEPVVARPPSTSYRIQKMVRRNRVAFGAITLVALALLFAVSVSIWQAIRVTQASASEQRQLKVAKEERDRAQTARELAEAQRIRAETGETVTRNLLYIANINLAQSDWDRNNLTRLARMLEETKSHPERGFEWFYWARQLHRPLRTFHGHLGAVSSLALSGDDRRLVTGGEDRVARIWDIESGQELLTLAGHFAAINAVQFSRDGRRVLTASADQTAKLWDSVTGRELFTFKRHGAAVFCAAISPDGTRVVTGGEDGLVKIWDASTGGEIMSLDSNRGAVFSMAISPDGLKLVCGYRFGMEVRDLASGKELLAIHARAGPVMAIALSPDSQKILAGESDGTVKVHAVANGAPLLQWNGHETNVRAVAYSSDGRRIVTGSEDQTAAVWDAVTGEESGRLRGHTDGVRAVAFSRDARLVLTGSRDGTARVWNAQTERDTLDLARAPDVVHSVAVSPDGRRLLTGAQQGEVSVWDSSNGQEILQLRGHTDWIPSVAFSPDGRKMVTASFDRTARIWDAATGREEFLLQGHGGRLTSVAFSSDSRRIATASYDHTVKVWDASTGKEQLTLPGHDAEVWGIAFSPEGSRLASGAADATTRIWNSNTGTRLFVLSGHSGPINSVRFSSDGRRVLTSSRDRTAKLWDAETGRELLTLEGHTGPLSFVNFFPGDHRIVTAGADNRIKVWDAATGRELLSLRAPSESTGALTLFPDGRKIVCATGGNTLQVWEAASPEQLVAWSEGEKAVAERIGKRALEAQAEEARERAIQASGAGGINRWLILAPIPLERFPERRLPLEHIPGENMLRPKVGDRIRVTGQELIWREASLTNYVIDFNQVIGHPAENCVGYAVTYLFTPRAVSGLRMRAGIDDTGIIFLNGQPIHQWTVRAAFKLDRDTVTDISLNEGLNVLVFKVMNGPGHWLGSIRLTDAQGSPITYIRATTNPQE